MVENEKQRLQQCKVHQGVAIRINNEEMLEQGSAKNK